MSIKTPSNGAAFSKNTKDIVMSRIKFTIGFISFCCLFLLVSAFKVSAATHLAVVSSVATQPNLQQSITHELRTNPNLELEKLNVHVNNGDVELKGEAKNGFERALAQKFLENMDGVKRIKNNIAIF